MTLKGIRRPVEMLMRENRKVYRCRAASNMKGHAEQCVEKYLELSNQDVTALKRVVTPCVDDNMFAPEEFQRKGELSDVASRIVLKALYLARLNRLDLLWTINHLARKVTKWDSNLIY